MIIIAYHTLCMVVECTATVGGESGKLEAARKGGKDGECGKGDESAQGGRRSKGCESCKEEKDGK